MRLPEAAASVDRILVSGKTFNAPHGDPLPQSPNVGYGNPTYGFSGSQKGGYLKSVGFNEVKIACVRSAHTTQVGYACCGWVGVLAFKSQTCSKLGVENFPHNLYWDLGTTKNVNNIF